MSIRGFVKAARWAGTCAGLLFLLTTSCNGLATINVAVRDAVTGQLVPAKICVLNTADGSRASVRADKSTGTNVYVWGYTMELGQGNGTMGIDSGTYDFYATAGIEWTVDAKPSVAVSGTTTSLEFRIQKVVPTSGWISADFHIHAYSSFDSWVLPQDRVVNYLVAGVEVMGSADHDCVADYAPIISSLGLSSKIASVRGAESTPKITAWADANGYCRNYTAGTIGSEPAHWNVFPLGAGLTYDTTLDEGAAPATIYDRLRAMQSDPVVIQLNHPNYTMPGATAPGWFQESNLDFRKDLPIPAGYGNGTAPNAFLRKPSTIPGSTTQGIDFDAIEIMPPDSTPDWRETRADWFALLDQGFLKIGTANSDSHNAERTAGFPRTYIKVPNDTPTGVTPTDIRDHLLAGEVMGTSGPFLSFTIDGAGLGSLVTDADGTVSASVVVSGAPWVEILEVRIVRNGQLVWSQSLSPQNPEPLVRYSATFSLPVTKDSWFILEAGSPLPLNPLDPMYIPSNYHKFANDRVPIAFTNPVYVDFDADGSFTPPGL